MKIIDSHFHLYKSAQAGLLAQGGQSLIGFSGTLEEAMPIIDRCGFSKIIGLAVMPISLMRATAMEKWPQSLSSSSRQELAAELEEKLQARLTAYNDWLCRASQDDDRIVPAIACDPTIDSQYMTTEMLSKLDEFKLKVVKIHPSANQVAPTYEGYEPILAMAQEKGITVISHGGLTMEDPEGRLCTPQAFEHVLETFPQLKLVVAHLAYPHTKEIAELAQRYSNLYVDLSFVLRNSPLTDDTFCELIRSIGAEQVLFGSDFPWSDPESDKVRFLSLNLSHEEQERVAWRNAVEVFDLI